MPTSQNEYGILNKTQRQLVEEMEQIVTIDCHEHLIPEEHRLNSEVDIFTLFSHYTRHDLVNQGMSVRDYNMLHDKRIPLEARWGIFEPHWENIRWSSYAKSALLTARKFYGAEDINSTNYKTVSENIKNTNKPGLYQKILKDTCNIGISLLHHDYPYPEVDRNFFATVTHMTFFHDTNSWERLSRPTFNPRAQVNTLEDYLNAAEEFIIDAKSKGAVGLKMPVREMGQPSRGEAVRAFEKLKDGSIDELPPVNSIYDYVMDHIAALAYEYDLVIAVHTGYWEDFRRLNPVHIIPLLMRHPKTRFDIFHLGFPWVRETLMLGKGFPNVWLNMCWTYIISQKFATDALTEAVELVSMNKILGFGGDYDGPVEKVYGHLILARESMARALSGKIDSGDMSMTQAKRILQKWLHDNPKDLYKLEI